MEDRKNFTARIAHFVHNNLLWLLLGAYVAAAVLPETGLWLRSINLGSWEWLGSRTQVSLPALLLALLLFNAGLGVQARRLKGLFASPLVLAAGLAANLAVPILFTLGLAQVLIIWHNPAEVQDVLAGLALVAAMPVAGSSAAWTQNADGDLALSLGLVVFSTCLSPLTTPATLHVVGWVANGLHADSLRALAEDGAGIFLTLFVLIPCLAGIAARGILGEQIVARAKTGLRLATAAILLLLCYANAAVALPQAIAYPDWDFLAVVLAVVLVLCATAFASGHLLARLLRADSSRRTALIFGLGMNNNGTALVLASTALAAFPGAMLPVIFYNLIQHVAAGIASFLGERGRRAAPASESAS